MKDQWDIIILDRMLPNNVDGLSILSTLRALGKKTPVLVLTRCRLSTTGLTVYGPAVTTIWSSRSPSPSWSPGWMPWSGGRAPIRT